MGVVNIPLTDEMSAFIESQVAREGYASAREYLHALIRVAQRRQARRDMEAKLLEGLQGPTVELTREDRESIRWEALEEIAG